MIPVSVKWNTQERLINLQWDGLISSEWKEGRTSIKILGCSIPIPTKKQKIQLAGKLPLRWIYLKGIFSFLTRLKLKKLEATLSFPDPMVNGILYGWTSAIQTGNSNRKIHVTINFLGENWCEGEMTLSLKIFFQYLRRWIFPLIREMRGRKLRKGGES
jgi:hypothetical protein